MGQQERGRWYLGDDKNISNDGETIERSAPC